MRKVFFILSLISIIIACLSCEKAPVEAGFEDIEDMTIYDFLVENESEYSSFQSILIEGGISKTLSAYNPDGLDYTLFLPDNNAIASFIGENPEYSSLNDLLDDLDYVAELSRYHVVNLGILSSEFPFGALPEFTFSGDLLTVTFVAETDTSYYKINNQAPVIRPDIELSNGIIHVISSTLIPITFTSYDWLEQNQEYSIFTDLIDLTGFKETIDINLKVETGDVQPFTLLVEPDSIYFAFDILTIDDLVAMISPNRTDYSSTANPLYNYAGYHILEGSRFLNDFEGKVTNYITYSEIPMKIHGTGLEIKINKGFEIFDTIISQNDTTIIDFVGFYYDESNVITQSGAIHLINRQLKQQPPSRAIKTYEFYEEPLLNEYRLEPGEYLIEDTSWLDVIKWSGTDLFFVESGDQDHPAWGGDFLFMDGDFSISYTFPKIIQGEYMVFLGAGAFNWDNSLVEVFIDGKNIGGLIDLTSGGNAGNPFARIELGVIKFLKYEEHTVQIRSLIPGRFTWDYIRFEPI